MSTEFSLYKEMLKLWYKGEEITEASSIKQHLSDVECNAYNTHLQEEKKAIRSSHIFGIVSFLSLVSILFINEKTLETFNAKIMVVVCIMLADTIIIVLTSRIFKDKTLNIIKTIVKSKENKKSSNEN